MGTACQAQRQHPAQLRADGTTASCTSESGATTATGATATSPLAVAKPLSRGVITTRCKFASHRVEMGLPPYEPLPPALLCREYREVEVNQDTLHPLSGPSLCLPHYVAVESTATPPCTARSSLCPPSSATPSTNGETLEGGDAASLNKSTHATASPSGGAKQSGGNTLASFSHIEACDANRTPVIIRTVSSVDSLTASLTNNP